MSGFVGYIGSNTDDEKIIREMNQKIVHRGPDAEEYYANDGLHFGFRGLAPDESEKRRKHIFERNGLALVLDGRIYNAEEIKNDLLKRAYTFESSSPEEIILCAYEAYGEKEFLKKLRGPFALTVWDSKKKKLFGARDHFGMKPYYYTNIDNDFLFASEIKAFLSYPKFQKKLNPEALKNYLVFQYNPLEETFFKHVKKLRPGHFYTVEDANMKIESYFKIELDYRDIGLEHTVNSIEAEVEKAIECHKIEGAEVTSFLSGGVDSSFVASKAKVSKTFSVGFENKGFDETMYAKELSEILGAKNYSKIITPDEFFEGINKVQYYSDEPHANLSSVALYFLSKLAAEHTKMVLSGEGADELFAGYNEYEMPFLRRIYSKLPFSLRKYLFRKTKNKPHFRGKSIIMKFGEPPEDNYIGHANIMSDAEANSLLTATYRSEVRAKDLTKKYYDEVKSMDDVSKKLYLDMHMWIVDDILLKADKMTMANSLEMRGPLLDIELWNLARTIPPKYKIRGNITKYAFRKAAERTIPKDWSHRKKVGFLVPFVSFIKEKKYYEIVKNMFHKEFVSEFFDVEKINTLLDEHYQGIKNNGRKVYTIYTFLVWYEQYFIR